MGNIIQRIYKFFASLKLAVIVILSLAVISAIGTIVESKYDANTAQLLVYHSWFMYLTMVMLVVNLVFAAVERLPWKKKHIGFVTAHVGIIILIYGAFLTQRRGIDGSLALGIGESNQWVSIPRITDLIVYKTIDGQDYREVFREEVEFFTQPPTEGKPFVIPVDGDKIELIDHYRYAVSEDRVEKSERPQDGPGLRFQIKNANVNAIEWMVLTAGSAATYQMGPAEIILSREEKFAVPKGNALVLVPQSAADQFSYFVYTASKGGLTKQGRVKVGETIETGWMGLEFKPLVFYPRAIKRQMFRRLERPTPLSEQALKFKFRSETHEMGLNSIVKLFTESAAYVISFSNRRIPIGFEMKLLDFQVGRYPGTSMAMSYESRVEVDGGAHLISMNEPLKHKGLTFYQSSFEQDENGKPTLSILSVNDDPGRFLKYFGSSLILIGSLLLFYFRRALAKAPTGSAT